ncbi:MAG: ECF-type sigma factor [Acidobacteriota bacterium]
MAGEITHLLTAWSDGDKRALGELIPKVYSQLEAIAGGYLRSERDGDSLGPGGLVHEAYLRLVDLDRARFRDREHFYAVSAQLMRQILVDHARREGRQKRGGGSQRVDLEDALNVARERPPDLLALDDALHSLAKLDPMQAKIVELRYFGGLDRDQIARALGISSATVTRRWLTARALLYRSIRDSRERHGAKESESASAGDAPAMPEE